MVAIKSILVSLTLSTVLSSAAPANPRVGASLPLPASVSATPSGSAHHHHHHHHHRPSGSLGSVAPAATGLQRSKTQQQLPNQRLPIQQRGLKDIAAKGAQLVQKFHTPKQTLPRDLGSLEGSLAKINRMPKRPHSPDHIRHGRPIKQRGISLKQIGAKGSQLVQKFHTPKQTLPRDLRLPGPLGGALAKISRMHRRSDLPAHFTRSVQQRRLSLKQIGSKGAQLVQEFHTPKQTLPRDLVSIGARGTKGSGGLPMGSHLKQAPIPSVFNANVALPASDSAKKPAGATGALRSKMQKRPNQRQSMANQRREKVGNRHPGRIPNSRLHNEQPPQSGLPHSKSPLVNNILGELP